VPRPSAPTPTSHNHDRLEALLAEYSELSADNRSRVDLQQRNANVAIVLMTALTGYLVSYWKDHGLDHRPASLFLSEIMLLVVIGPLFANIFIWRHIDHDENIQDKAAYVHAKIRPVVNRESASQNLLAFEDFLKQRRKRRLITLTPLVALGNEHIPLLLFSGAYLSLGWYVRFQVPHYAGEAHKLFGWILYVASVLFVVTVWMAYRSARGYLDVAPSSSTKGSDAAP
jgi:hypothetical protein